MASFYSIYYDLGVQSSGVIGFDDLQRVLDLITYEAHWLLEALLERRWTGRPGYPVKALWRAYTASFLLNLPHTNALIRRLQDDAGLRNLCGFGDVLPHRTTFNRFIGRLSRYADLVEDALARVTDELKTLLPELGDEVAIDSTAVRTHSNPNRKNVSDPEAGWGVKHSARAKDGATDYFFGYKVHAVADVKHGIPLAQIVTSGNRNDSPLLPKVMEKAQAFYPWLKPKIAVGDRGYDSKGNHTWLDERGIIPIIHIRGLSNKKLYDGIYTKEGIPTCLGGVPMEYTETNPVTGHHRYVCVEGGCHLKGSNKGGIAHCDSEVWEDPSSNIRLFGKIRRNSPEWSSHYAKRQAIERTFKSLKESLRLERHCVRGLRQIRLHTLMSTWALQATVLANVRAGRMAEMRWMVKKVA